MKTRVNMATVEVGRLSEPPVRRTPRRGVPTLADLQITEEGCHES